MKNNGYGERDLDFFLRGKKEKKKKRRDDWKCVK